MGYPLAEMKRRPVLALLALLLCCAPAIEAKKKQKTRIEIEPGPLEILPEEAAIEADPARGVQHGVILVDETDWREEILGGTTVSHHLRAKILSSDARSLADVELPPSLRDPKVKRWWARTILPDGNVIELTKDALEPQTLAEARGFEVRTLRAALPAVEPGCVIDYGYEVLIESLIADRVVLLQREWPVREIRFRWQPAPLLPGNFLLYRGEGLGIEYENDQRSVVVSARDLPPVPEEPHMPPARELRASATFYYVDEVYGEQDRYWDSIARRVVRSTDRFIADRRATRQALEAIGIPDDADLGDRLRYVYDWIQRNVEIRNLRTAEQIELDEGDDDKARNHNDWVLEHRQARGWQPDRLFIGFARELGASAELVLVTDREEQYWWPALLDWGQFDDAVVAVQLPGEQQHFVDPGSGLPYGELPWWYTGLPAAMFAKTGYRQVLVPLPSARENVTRSFARLEFAEDNEVATVSWTRDYAPQAGLIPRRWLRRANPEEREDRLYELCGESNDVEVLSASAPDLERQTGALRIECEIEMYLEPLEEDVGRYFWTLDGIYNPALPELPPGERVNSVILDYPRVDVTEIEILAPDGFEPVEPPATKRVSSPFGNYVLECTRIEGGYRVKRSAALVALGVKPSDYDDLVDYLLEVKRADATSVEFRRKQTP